MQGPQEPCFGTVAGSAYVQALLQPRLKAQHIAGLHPGKLLRAKVLHWNLPWGFAWQDKSCVCAMSILQALLSLLSRSKDQPVVA